jgi:hypothetical protein
MYQSRVRREWFTALKRNKGFNLEIIREDLMRSYTNIVNDQEREKAVAREIEEVRRFEPLHRTMLISHLFPLPFRPKPKSSPPDGCHSHFNTRIAVLLAVPHCRCLPAVMTCPPPLAAIAPWLLYCCSLTSLLFAGCDDLPPPPPLAAFCAAVAVAVVVSHCHCLPAVMTCPPLAAFALQLLCCLLSQHRRCLPAVPTCPHLHHHPHAP